MHMAEQEVSAACRREQCYPEILEDEENSESNLYQMYLLLYHVYSCEVRLERLLRSMWTVRQRGQSSDGTGSKTVLQRILVSTSWSRGSERDYQGGWEYCIKYIIV